MIRFAILLTLAVSNARASDNGKYYTCDTSILESDNQCIFDLTGEHKGKVLHSILENVQDFFTRYCHRQTNNYEQGQKNWAHF